MNNKLIKGIVGLLTLCLIGLFIYHGVNKNKEQSFLNKSVVLKGIITSEKENFFRDERVTAIFKKEGLDIQFERWASGKMAKVSDIKEFGEYADFVFPPGVQTSDKIKNNLKRAQAYNVFYSPMVVATWKPIEEILKNNNLTIQTNSYTALDMNKFLPLMSNKVKWRDFKKSDENKIKKKVLIFTSDARYSNAAKMFIALTGYIYNNGEVITTQEQVNKISPMIKNLMNAQGHRESSSTNLLQDYMAIGMGKTPLVFGYESEFVEQVVKNKAANPKMVLMYPSPTMFTKHVMVIFKPEAKKLVNLMLTNKELQQIASEYGFRFAGNNHVKESAAKYGLTIPEEVVDVVDPPSFDILEQMVTVIVE